MSAYSSYVRDFPFRCGEILEEFRLPALRRGRDVTLLLSISTAALIIPYERLGTPNATSHPLRDRDRYPKAARQYEELLDKPFLSSPLWGREEVSTWRKGSVQDVRSGGPDTWPELRDARSMPSDVPVSAVLSILRNALAHGNVLTEGGVIRNIVLLAREGRTAFGFISVSPHDFRKFMMDYIGFLKDLNFAEVLLGEELGVARM
ncbi:hypothetical protein [Candidatus Palauibacter sp.]|uniref:hypothetical protein n=1 Tax=Candidatus Palauibacter sp. TaxID=3101350 RepID=UPI003B0240F9